MLGRWKKSCHLESRIHPFTVVSHTIYQSLTSLMVQVWNAHYVELDKYIWLRKCCYWCIFLTLVCSLGVICITAQLMMMMMMMANCMYIFLSIFPHCCDVEIHLPIFCVATPSPLTYHWFLASKYKYMGSKRYLY